MPDINGIPYVESSDLVSAYPAVSQSLAQEVSDQLASKLDLAGGKILQVVRATDSTDRTTTSTSLVDVTGMSVTITPQRSDSAVMLIAACRLQTTNTSGGSDLRGTLVITDSSNNSITGEISYGDFNDDTGGSANGVTLIGYATPATTSATTYKLRFKSGLATTTTAVQNATATGQMYAIEVSA